MDQQKPYVEDYAWITESLAELFPVPMVRQPSPLKGMLGEPLSREAAADARELLLGGFGHKHVTFSGNLTVFHRWMLERVPAEYHILSWVGDVQQVRNLIRERKFIENHNNMEVRAWIAGDGGLRVVHYTASRFPEATQFGELECAHCGLRERAALRVSDMTPLPGRIPRHIHKECQSLDYRFPFYRQREAAEAAAAAVEDPKFLQPAAADIHGARARHQQQERRRVRQAGGGQ